MNNISLKSIKYESIKAIFNSITDSEKISRAAISEKTDLSLVTVGKIADALLDLNIVSQVKEIKPQAGRRAGILSVNENKFSMIFDITTYEFRIAVLNLRLCLVEHVRIPFKPEIPYIENLRALFSEGLAMISRKYNMDDCFGIGIAVPGPYNSEIDYINTCRIPELTEIRISEIAHEYFGTLPLIIDSQINAAARSNISHVDGYENKNLLYWYIGTSYVCGAYMVKGELILGKDQHACDFGRMIARRGCTLDDLIADCADEDKLAEILVGPLYNIIQVINPHTLIMEFDVSFPCDGILEKIRTTLLSRFSLDENIVPEMKCACCRFRNSHRGLTMALREIWLDRIVFGSSQN